MPDVLVVQIHPQFAGERIHVNRHEDILEPIRFCMGGDFHSYVSALIDKNEELKETIRDCDICSF